MLIQTLSLFEGIENEGLRRGLTLESLNLNLVKYRSYDDLRSKLIKM